MTDEVLYYSNRGKGPAVARIILIADGIVTLERKPSIASRGKWFRFTLPEKFFKSEDCGWKARNKLAAQGQ